MASIAAQAEAAVRYTEAPGHATRLALEAAHQGCERVIALGGDGTITEVVQGLVGTTVSLGIVPGGTGNDLCRTLNIPKSPVEAAQLALQGQAAPIDAGQIEGGPYWVNMAGAGFDAEVTRNTNRFPKYLGGTVPYVLGIVRTLFRFGPVAMEIDVDGRRLDRRALLVAVGNGKTTGGGMRLLPMAEVNDGMLDVLIGGDIGRAEIVGLTPKLYSGGHVGHPKVEFTRGRRITLRAASPVAAYADGELAGELPITFICHPGLLSVVSGPPARPG